MVFSVRQRAYGDRPCQLPKTRPTDADVGAFLEAVPDQRRRDEARTVCRLMQEVTGEVPVLWGTGIVGFGCVRLRYASTSSRR